MMDITSDILLVIVPASVLFTAWLLLRRRIHARLLLTVTWCAVFFVLGLIGWLTWEQTHECTRLASALLVTSSVWFVGPFLVLTVRTRWAWPVSAVACVALSFASVYACFFLLAVTGQVWGM